MCVEVTKCFFTTSMSPNRIKSIKQRVQESQYDLIPIFELAAEEVLEKNPKI